MIWCMTALRAMDRMHTRRTDAELRLWLFTVMHNLFVSRTPRARVRARNASTDCMRRRLADPRARRTIFTGPTWFARWISCRTSSAPCCCWYQ